jgi:hypothetical protein
LPVLYVENLVPNGNGGRCRRMLVTPIGPQKRSTDLGTYPEALANAKHVVLVMGEEGNRHYLGVWRVSQFEPWTDKRPGSIRLHEQAATVA